MAYGPTPEELVEWMSNPEEIDRRLKGTEHAHLIDPRAHQQRAGVLASLGLVADSLRLLAEIERRQRGRGRPLSGQKNAKDGSSSLRSRQSAKPFVHCKVSGSTG